MGELDRVKARIDKSGASGVEASRIRDDYSPVGDAIMMNLIASGEYVQRKTPAHDFAAKWRIFKKGYEPY